HVAVRLAELLEGLLQVDDVDPVALAEDVLLHLRVPPLGLMAEVHSGLQQLLHRQRGHACPLFRLASDPERRAHPALPRTVAPGPKLGIVWVGGPPPPAPAAAPSPPSRASPSSPPSPPAR